MTAAIDFSHVSKRYHRGTGRGSLRDAIPAILPRLLGRRPARVDDAFWALHDVSFAVQRGEALGIIGPNGAGKTTTLKLLSRVTRPTSGTITVNGRIAALIELGAGFHPDLTGRENVFLNGAILGLSRAEIKRKFDRIVAFAELERFIDMPVKRYSSGMYVRLGFAVAAHVDPQVLLTDEILAVGDLAYQEKCLQRMREFAQEGRTVVIVSHDLNSVASMCQRALLLSGGQLIASGPTTEVIDQYHRLSAQLTRRVERRQDLVEQGIEDLYATLGAEIHTISLLDAHGLACHTLQSGAPTILRLEVEFHEAADDPVIGFILRRMDGMTIYATNSLWLQVVTGHFAPGQHITIEYHQPMAVLGGSYIISTGLAYHDLKAFYDWREAALSFFVHDGGVASGVLNLQPRIYIDGREIKGEQR